MEPEVSSKELGRSWARLIQKIYNVDPLVCPKCRGKMKIIASIKARDVIEKILRHLGLWETHNPLFDGGTIPISAYTPC